MIIIGMDDGINEEKLLLFNDRDAWWSRPILMDTKMLCEKPPLSSAPGSLIIHRRNAKNALQERKNGDL